jgi:hypothetical protein
VATIILGAFYARRQLPLFVTDLGKHACVPLTVTTLFLYTRIFNNTGGSVLLAMLLHASKGAIVDFIPVFSGNVGVLKELVAGRSVLRVDAADQVRAE